MKVSRRPVRLARFVRSVKAPCGFSSPIPGCDALAWARWRGREITVFSSPLPNKVERCDSPAVWEITPQTRYRMRLPVVRGGYFVVCRHQILFPRKRS